MDGFEAVALASLVVFYFGALFLVLRLIRYVRYELWASAGWTATTTRCLADAARVRNGMYKQLERRERRLAQRSSPAAASQPTTDESKANGLVELGPQDGIDDGAKTAEADTGAHGGTAANPQDRHEDNEPT